MERSSLQLLVQYRRRKAFRLCMNCARPLKYISRLLCPFCRYFKYCSPVCLERDRPVHRLMCQPFVLINDNRQASTDRETMISKAVICRAKLLDSEGNLSSPSVMEDLYLVKSSRRFSKVVASLVAGSKSTPGSKSEPESKSDQGSKNGPESVSNSEFTDDVVSKSKYESISHNKTKNQYGSISDSSCKKYSKSEDCSRCTHENGCRNDTKFKNDIESTSNSRIMSDSELKSNSGFKSNSSFKSDSKLKSGNGFKSDNEFKNETTCKTDSEFIKSDSGSKKDTGTSRSKVGIPDPAQKYTNASFTVKVNNLGQPTIVSEVFQNAPSCEAKFPNSESHLGNHAAHSNNSQSSSRNISDNKSGQTSLTESFGSGWWGKTNKDSSRKSTQRNTSSKLLNSGKNQQTKSRDKEKSHGYKAVNSAEGKVSDSVETSKRTEPQTFGSGWWQGRLPHANSSTTRQEVKVNSQGKESSNSNGQCEESNAQRTSNSSKLSKVARKNSALDNTKFDENGSGKTSNNDCTLNSSSHSNTSASTTSTHRKETESENFGAGWWKHPSNGHNTGSGNSTKTTTDKTSTKAGNSTKTATGKVSTKAGKAKCEDEQKKESDKRYDFVNTCTDVCRFKVYLTAEHIVRFAKVASRILSSLIHSEAIHGRALVMDLLSVPGLWRASLGGSRISLVVEIVRRFPSDMPAVIVQDKLGHIAPVVFNTSDSTTYKVPGTGGLVLLTISDCLKPGTFVLLRGASWDQLQDGSLIIAMRDMTCVDFIFYELIQ